MRRLAIFCLLCMIDVATLHAAETMGRLFFTPAQRATLDAGKELEKPKGAERVIKGPRSVKLNGVVKRSDGESMVWINGKPVVQGSSVAASVSAADPAAVRVRVKGEDRAADLRVGQTLDTASGRIDKFAPADGKDPRRKANPSPAASTAEKSGDASSAEHPADGSK